MNVNQNPEQIARDKIDRMLTAAGWVVGDKNTNVRSAKGIAIREYQTEVGPVDYALFVNAKPAGVIEAKREEEGHRITTVEEQSMGYAQAAWKHVGNQPINFIYESTGTLTRFTDLRDPKPRARTVFGFHQPDTMAEWMKQERSLRARLRQYPTLDPAGLRPAQIVAINKLEKSFGENRPKALIQMATGAGKTFTAATFIYRLLKHAKAKRILFLVDTKNLGEQAESEFMKYAPRDDNRLFTELYNVQRLSSSYIANDSHVVISTIQRLYATLKGEELDESAELDNPNESTWMEQQRKDKQPLPVVYNEKIPLEHFDFIVIDECHRSIYNLWQQVLDYFDGFLIGLTATPDKRTFAFFDENVVSEYTYEESVRDGVNVDYEIYTIETEITKKGSEIKAGWDVARRDKLTRQQRWGREDEDTRYHSNELDKKVVNVSQIRNIIREFRRALRTDIFPDRLDKDGNYEVPKTLVFAKTDSHADDIINIIREEFGEGNDFCKKVTYKITEDPKTVLNNFRNAYDPRIAVTVDMIATGTDVKPLEVLLFMRDVKSTNYFEQMKGRGSRTINKDQFRATTTSLIGKTHFIIVDAVGVTKSKKTDSRPLERKRGVLLKDLLGAVTTGVAEEDLFTSLASRLSRLGKQITPREEEKLLELTGGKSIKQIVGELLNAYDPDLIEERVQERLRQPDALAADAEREEIQEALINTAAATFTGEVNEYIENVRKIHEQIIDTHNVDVVTKSEWDKSSNEKASQTVADFTAFIEENRDEITALRYFYGQPYQRRELTFKLVREAMEQLRLQRPALAPHYVWEAYAQLENVKSESPKNELVALVSLIRRVCGLDDELTAYPSVVDKRFQDWVFQQQAGPVKFNSAQMDWLRLLKNHVAASFHIQLDDLDYTPFDASGGRGKMYQLFGDDMNRVLEELNAALVA